jgi:hypothetical protein
MYDETVYLLDLCILSYHLQRPDADLVLRSLLCISQKRNRNEMGLMEALREPVFSDFKRIYPWRPSFTRHNGLNKPSTNKRLFQRVRNGIV